MLVLKSSQIWCSGDGACAWNVDTGDIDKDRVTEMITLDACLLASNVVGT